ncbi:zona pellucida sperm-binding protein 2-like [Erpetoichthys calabaricus]|uniref:Zona pellucida glycoprotein 2 n=1 Tax=Erpetoichthys calabaricus TaxID=27687 RepID=A0A8C4T8J3_ERPCA|nr:zona pellucida sperm-binding protein 2-like [Erpetoichthys calabaricus]
MRAVLYLPYFLSFILGWMVPTYVNALPGDVTCLEDTMVLELPPGAKRTYRLFVVGSNNRMVLVDKWYETTCLYSVDVGSIFSFSAAYDACDVQALDNGYSLKVVLQYFSTTMGKSIQTTYNMFCVPPIVVPLLISVEAGNTVCNQTFMEVSILEQLPSFDESNASAPVWNVSINDGSSVIKMSLSEAQLNGYEFLSGANTLVIRTYFNATGLQVFQDLSTNVTLYFSDVLFSCYTGFAQINVRVKMLCAPDLVSCNDNSLLMVVPPFPGTFTGLTIGALQYLPSSSSPDVSITNETAGLVISISKRYPMAWTQACQKYQESGERTVLPATVLSFNVSQMPVSFNVWSSCPCVLNSTELCHGGFMDFVVRSNSTVPSLDLTKVRLRDPTCLPVKSLPDALWYHIPLLSCGTTVKVQNGALMYENEVRAVLSDWPLGIITRDSELRVTVRCYYNASSDEGLVLNISNNAPPPPAINQGDLTIVLQAYPDELYSAPYSNQDYPIVKYLRAPIYLEVQVLNRQDPNIELVLENCWATAHPDPNSLPRWSLITAGCPYGGDNYPTVMHPMSDFTGIPFPSHYKRFDVKAFTFVSNGAALDNAMYFHCSALICDLSKLDSVECAAHCQVPTRVRHRREPHSAVLGETMSSLPGPITSIQDQLLLQSLELPHSLKLEKRRD